MKKIHLLLVLLTMSFTFGQDHQAVLKSLDKNADRYANIALTIWDLCRDGLSRRKE